MKAIVNDRYGSPDVLELREIDKPEVTDDGVLVRVRATSVNAYDWHMMRGKPYIARVSEGPAQTKDACPWRRRGRSRRGRWEERDPPQAR